MLILHTQLLLYNINFNDLIKSYTTQIQLLKLIKYPKSEGHVLKFYETVTSYLLLQVYNKREK